MAFPLTRLDVATALDQGIQAKLDQKEKPVTFGYASGSPQRFADRPQRLAGARRDQLKEAIGMAGEFGAMAAGKGDPGMKRYLKDFVSAMQSGPYALSLPGDPSSEQA